MAAEDDIAASLPQPPPAAPARRADTISMALERFDAKARGDAVPDRIARAPRPRRSIGRPQIATALALALVALIGLPVAWNSWEQWETEPSDRVVLNSSPSPDRVEPLASDAPATPAPSVRQGRGKSQPPVAADILPAPQSPMDASSSESGRAMSPAPLALAPEPAPPPPPPPPPRAVAQDARTSASPVRPSIGVERNEIAATGAGPAAGTNSAGKARGSFAESARADEVEDRQVVVTGTSVRKSSVERGDWNACTLADPARSMRGCPARLGEGLRHAWQGDVEEAVSSFDQAIRAAPRDSLAWLNRGLAYRRLGNLDRALADLDHAVRLAPGSARTYYQRSLLLRDKGDTRRAQADERQAVRLDPRYSEVVD